MTPPTPLTANVEWVSRVVKLLCTRTLQQFADEARQDGESLRDLVDRYDIDYAWQVLGSKRLLDATVAELENRMQRKPTSEQQAEVAAVLHAVAVGIASEHIMSFDNDLAQQLAEMMIEVWGVAQKERAPSEAV